MSEKLNKQLNFLSGFVLIAFPIVLLIDDLLPAETSPMQFIVSLLAAWFFGASLIALCRLLWVHRPRAVVVAGAFALAGIFGSVGIMVFRFVTGMIRQTEGAIGNAAQFGAALGKTAPFIFMPGLITPMVLLFLAAMLFRFQSKSKWVWIIVCAGALLFPLGRIFLGQTVILTSDALLLIGLGFVGWQMLFGGLGAGENNLSRNLKKPLAAILTLTLVFAALSSDKSPSFLTPKVSADNIYFPLSSANPLQQNWSNTNLITTNNDWSGVPSIIGYSGRRDETTQQDVDPQTLLADYSAQPYVFANITSPNSTTSGTGGTAFVEFEIPNPVVGFRGSPLHDAPNLDIRLDTTACLAANDIRVSYNLRDIDGGGNDAPQRVALQYRIGDTGDYTNLPAGYVDDATTGPNLATLVTNINVALPADAKNQPQLHVRIMTSNATGVDEYVGIDDINVSCGVLTAASAAVAGRVMTAAGRGISRVFLTLVSMTGEIRTAQTNNFGYYRFAEVPVGETYIVQLRSKRYQFAPDTTVFSLTEEITNLDFTAFELFDGNVKF